MSLKVYNSLSQKKENLRPLKENKVNIFVCGPTVYDFSHIGHARTYIFFDFVVKYLRSRNYRVFYLQNITDIDDKIINRAFEKGVSWKDLSRKFEREYLKDMNALNINSVSKYARATVHIKEITSQVKRLLGKGYAYQIRDGIYYDISRFKDYGKLSKRTFLQAEDAVSQIDEGVEKRNKGDFCLWKRSKIGEPTWENLWLPGRPGWHVEDTAITEKYFGPQYDIHGGAIDLIFPHHEAEIAIMEAISNRKPMVKFWLHTGFLTVKGKKMSKSLRNFITIRDFLKKHSARALRLFVLNSHYRSPIDYSEKKIEQVENQLARIDEFLDKLQFRIGKTKIPETFINQISKYSQAFEKALEDDFNTPKAIGIIFNLINRSNFLISKNNLGSNDKKEILKFLRNIDKFLCFIFPEKINKKIPKQVLKLAEKREEARKKANFRKADEIRKKIKQLGYWIEDTREGPKIKKI